MDQEATQYWERTERLLTRLLKLLPERNFAIRLGTGRTLAAPAGGRTDFILHLKRPAALKAMLAPPNTLGFGEGYLFDDFDVEGDIVAAFGAVETMRFERPSWPELIYFWRELNYLARAARRAPPDNATFTAYEPAGALYSVERDIQSAQFVYDVSNDFYRLWLDKRMVYSCAIFADETQSLDEAQLNKLQTVGEALELAPGHRFLDIGCGWGGLIIHAASSFGADATGITLSQAQVDEASQRIAALDIGARCRATVQHYDTHAGGPYDKIASIGMFEHVGPKRLAGYFQRAHRLLKENGLFYLQGGVKRPVAEGGLPWMRWLRKGPEAFADKYAFPDSALCTLDQVLQAAEANGFEVLWYNSLRGDYVRTLQAWLDRLEESRLKAVTHMGESGYRAWRVMLAGYLYLVRAGKLSEMQCLMRRH